MKSRFGTRFLFLAIACIGCQKKDHLKSEGPTSDRNQDALRAREAGAEGSLAKHQVGNRVEWQGYSFEKNGVPLSVKYGESESGRSPMLITTEIEESGVGLGTTKGTNEGPRSWYVAGANGKSLGSLEGGEVAFHSNGKTTILAKSWDPRLLSSAPSELEAYVSKVLGNLPIATGER